MRRIFNHITSLSMPLAHVSIAVSSLDSALEFYQAALKPLNYGIFMKLENTVGMTVKYDGPDFWMHSCPEMKAEEKGKGRTHVAFKASSRRAVHNFYEAALYVFFLLTPALSTLFSTLLFS